MFKLVIVDDEKMIRNGLVQTIAWDQLGIEVAGTAANGQAALEIIRNTRPQLLLTDIRMPKMDGLELTRILHEEMPELKVVIISGFEDFSYAQQALRYHAVDYILKPVGAEALFEVMRKLVNTLQDEFQKELSLVDAKKTLQSAIEHYLNLFKTGQESQCLTELDLILQRLETKAISINQLRKFALELATQVRDYCKKIGIEPDNVDQTDLGALSLIGTSLELQNWLRQFTIAVLGCLTKNGDHTNHQAIKKALEYINAHFHEDLSINIVAEQVYLSPSYFSHIFKKMRNESFTDYLNAVRIAKAKELLKENRYKVYEVSNLVGYSDYKYFSSVFKKNTGISPTDFCLLNE